MNIERMLWAINPLNNTTNLKIEGSVSTEKIEGMSAQIEVHSNLKPNTNKVVLSTPKITPENIDKIASAKNSETGESIDIKKLFNEKELQNVCNALNICLQNNTKLAAEKAGLTVSQTVDDTSLITELSNRDGSSLKADDINKYLEKSNSELTCVSPKLINQEVESMQNKVVLLPAPSTTTTTYKPQLPTPPLIAPIETKPGQTNEDDALQTNSVKKM